MNFRQNFSQKKNTFAISEKTLAETFHYIPKGLRKGNPFQGPFAQLSYIYIYVHNLSMYINVSLILRVIYIQASNHTPICECFW